MEKHSTILALQTLLQTLMTGKFDNNTLEFNKKLSVQLLQFRNIVFDRGQRYGNPNYDPVPLEKELGVIALNLHGVILDQVLSADISMLTATDLMHWYGDIKWFSYTEKQAKVFTKLRTEIMVRAKTTLGDNPDKPEIKQMAILARFVNHRSNSGNPEHVESAKILQQYKQSDSSSIIEDLSCLTV